MKKIFLLAVLLTFMNIAQIALALPDLQVYIPGATAMDFNGDEDTWFTAGTPGSFQLKVVGSYGPNDISITNGTILVTIPQGQSGSISGLGVGTFHSDLSFLPDTNPALNHYPLNQWNLFDFYTFDIGSFAKNTPVTLPDYNADSGVITYKANATGEEKTYNLDISGYTYLHFDVYAKFIDKQGEDWRANPGSHDSSGDSHSPEPATIAMFGMGLFGISKTLSKKKKCH